MKPRLIEVVAQPLLQAWVEVVQLHERVQVLDVVLEEHLIWPQRRNDAADSTDYHGEDHGTGEHDDGRERLLQIVAWGWGDIAVADGRERHDAPVQGGVVYRQGGHAHPRAFGGVVGIVVVLRRGRALEWGVFYGVTPALHIIGARVGVVGGDLEAVAVAPHPRVHPFLLEGCLHAPEAREPVRAEHHDEGALHERDIGVVDRDGGLPALDET
eukprot:7002958-Prymnesium_polylepis.1